MATKRQILDMLEGSLKALKDAGADYAQAVYGQTSSIDVGLREGRVTDLAVKPDSSGIDLIAYVGDKWGEASPDTRRPHFLKEGAQAAVDAARMKTDNPDQRRPERELLAKVRNNRSLDLYDRTKPSVNEMIEQMREAESIALQTPLITLSEGASAHWSHSLTIGLTSDGFMTESKKSYSSLSLSLIAEKEGEKTTNADSCWARYRSDLKNPADIGRLAADKTVADLNPKAPPLSGVLPVIFSPEAASGLLGHFADAASGENIFMKRSFLKKEDLGKPLFPKGMIIRDDPHKLRGFRSSMFTGSGLPTRKSDPVVDGVLSAFFLGLESARRLGFPLTAISGGPSNLTIEPGPLSREALFGDVKDGLYVTSLMGQGVNTVNGDYSRAAKGFWIKNGILTHPVAEATIAGNLKDMFNRMTAANDLDRDRKRAPTVRVEGMTIS